MANAEIVSFNKSNEGALLKVQNICEGEIDIAERLDKLFDQLRGVDHSGLDAMPREKVGTGLETNLDKIAQLLKRIDLKLLDVEQIFYSKQP